MWRANKTESRAYENDNFPIKTFDETLTLPARFAAHSIRSRPALRFRQTRKRFVKTVAARLEIPSWVMMRFLATQPGTTTRPLVTMRFLPTTLAVSILPPVLMR
jgi:hypothetical protein